MLAQACSDGGAAQNGTSGDVSLGKRYDMHHGCAMGLPSPCRARCVEGGPARATVLSAEERHAIAEKAVAAQ